jgi:predicted acetyltransferase
MRHRFGNDTDLDLLAAWNKQLIQDEGHRNPMTIPELKKRMANWISIDYKIVIFEAAGEPLAYALFKERKNEIYLRQLFVRRDKRRNGIGRQAVGILLKDIWPSYTRLTVEVLISNTVAVNFWHALGFKDYCLKLELTPSSSGEQQLSADV